MRESQREAGGHNQPTRSCRPPQLDASSVPGRVTATNQSGGTESVLVSSPDPTGVRFIVTAPTGEDQQAGSATPMPILCRRAAQQPRPLTSAGVSTPK